MASTKALPPLRSLLGHGLPRHSIHPSPRRYFSITPVFAAPHPSSSTSSARQSHSIAQPSEPAAYEDAPAPPYISPATSSKLSATSPFQPPSVSTPNHPSTRTTNPSDTGPIPIEMSPSMSDVSKRIKTAPARGSRGSNLKAQKSAITMTSSALDHLRALVSSPTEPKLLRIGVKSRGCAGMAYHLDYVSPPGGKFDEVVEQDGVKVLIDSKALFSIIGSRMDWRDNRLSAGFVFDNPNVIDTCGCGESFNIR